MMKHQELLKLALALELEVHTGSAGGLRLRRDEVQQELDQPTLADRELR
jgi:hypothetical protein